MIIGTKDRSSIAVSISIYRFLLAAYPAEFRQEYGEDMVQLFRDCALRAVGQSGSSGMVRLWAVTLLDLIQSLFEEHLQKETNMSKSTFIRISGWALVLAGIAFLMVFTGWYLDENYPLMHIDKSVYLSVSYIAFLYAGPVFLILGLLGLRARYGQVIGSGGSAALLLSAIVGLVMSLVGILGGEMELFGGYNESLWDLIIWGIAVQMIGLAIFGGLAIQRKPLPRGNGLAILSGILPIVLIIGLVTDIWEGSFPTFFEAALAIQGLATIVLGYILQGDAPLEEGAMATA
jgi:hypothetical protein